MNTDFASSVPGYESGQEMQQSLQIEPSLCVAHGE
jgi:hypothetical protein